MSLILMFLFSLPHVVSRKPPCRPSPPSVDVLVRKRSGTAETLEEGGLAVKPAKPDGTRSSQQDHHNHHYHYWWRHILTLVTVMSLSLSHSIIFIMIAVVNRDCHPLCHCHRHLPPLPKPPPNLTTQPPTTIAITIIVIAATTIIITTTTIIITTITITITISVFIIVIA